MKLCDCDCNKNKIKITLKPYEVKKRDNIFSIWRKKSKCVYVCDEKIFFYFVGQCY